jgi:hypothetical protein
VVRILSAFKSFVLLKYLGLCRVGPWIPGMLLGNRCLCSQKPLDFNPCGVSQYGFTVHNLEHGAIVS